MKTYLEIIRKLVAKNRELGDAKTKKANLGKPENIAALNMHIKKNNEFIKMYKDLTEEFVKDQRKDVQTFIHHYYFNASDSTTAVLATNNPQGMGESGFRREIERNSKKYMPYE